MRAPAISGRSAVASECQMGLRGLLEGHEQPSPLGRALAYPQLRFMGSKFRLLPGSTKESAYLISKSR
jgi:hypothetical protein